MSLVFVTPAEVSTQAVETTGLVTLCLDKTRLTPGAAAVDQALKGRLTRAAQGARFTGAKGQVLDLLAPEGLAFARVSLIGTGATEALDEAGAERAGAQAIKALASSGLETLRFDLCDLAPALAARAAFGAVLGGYRFDRYRTTLKPEQKPSVAHLVFVTDDPVAASAAFAPLSSLAEAVAFSRDLVSEPANTLFPEEFANRVKALEKVGLVVEVLGEAEMEALGFGALLGVGVGSERESKLAILRWNGADDPDAQPVAFVGKGVTFDTGGISIKPADGMEEMKGDMGGAAAVAGALYAIAARKAKANVVGVIGLVENMPDGKAQRPGDVVTSYSGQTIEVINTDAEGRLVLADALWYAQERFKPKFMVDLATLTGAIIIALGEDYAGLFSNDDTLSAQLTAAGDGEGELLWRLPLPASYEKQIESPIADVKNTGGRPGGSITAALFLQKFVRDLPWAHLDIASTAWKKGATNPLTPSWATGFGVRLLNRLVADHYEG